MAFASNGQSKTLEEKNYQQELLHLKQCAVTKEDIKNPEFLKKLSEIS